MRRKRNSTVGHESGARGGRPAKVSGQAAPEGAGTGDSRDETPGSNREARLDAALDATFPASDPFSMDPGSD
jgi:hypothetical protein